MKKTYSELLRDPRWQKRRLEIMNLAEFACEECQDTSTTLNVHHKIYRKGAMPWDYADEELACICENCHKAEHQLREELALSMSRMNSHSLEQLMGFAQGLEAKIAVFDIPRPDRVFPLRSKQRVRGFLEALWGGAIHPEFCEELTKFPFDLNEVAEFMKSGRPSRFN